MIPFSQKRKRKNTNISPLLLFSLVLSRCLSPLQQWRNSLILDHNSWILILPQRKFPPLHRQLLRDIAHGNFRPSTVTTARSPMTTPPLHLTGSRQLLYHQNPRRVLGEEKKWVIIVVIYVSSIFCLLLITNLFKAQFEIQLVFLFFFSFKYFILKCIFSSVRV